MAVTARVRSLVESMTNAERRIAALIVEDPAAIAQMTITELAAQAGTSQSSVVRTARRLGFSGYPELRLALAADGASTAAAINDNPALAGDIERDDSLDVAVHKLAVAEIGALDSTFRQLDVSVLRSVIEAMTAAARIDVYGFGVSGLVAGDLWQKLMRIGRNCHSFADTHLALTSAALLQPGDVALVISYSGVVVDALETARVAAGTGATVVAITSQPRSALARLADHVLVSAGRSEPLLPGAMAGRMSQLLVTDAIFVGVAQYDYDGALDALHATTSALDSHRQRRGVTTPPAPSRR